MPQGQVHPSSPTLNAVQCDYYDTWRCRSCTLMGTPYAVQLAAKDDRVRAVLGGRVDSWLAPFASRESGFRNKAKMVVGGTPERPSLGILDEHGRGVDLRHCGIHEPALQDALPVLADEIARIGLRPYDVPARTGELKNVLVTVSPDAELMVRFVLRSEGQVGRLRRALPALQAALPMLRCASVNLLPEHRAVTEGDVEIPLTEQQHLPVRVNDITLLLRPRSFFQTSTDVAAGLYRQAREWVLPQGSGSVLDLYCGVGGFALHLAAPGRQVHGVEVSEEAVESAQGAARVNDLEATFDAGDATAVSAAVGDADVVVVNPPRRGIGPSLCDRLEHSDAHLLVYSSCNVATLARDLDALPSWRPVQARAFDMFPQTDHCEVMVLLQR